MFFEIASAKTLAARVEKESRPSERADALSGSRGKGSITQRREKEVGCAHQKRNRDLFWARCVQAGRGEKRPTV